MKTRRKVLASVCIILLAAINLWPWPNYRSRAGDARLLNPPEIVDVWILVDGGDVECSKAEEILSSLRSPKSFGVVLTLAKDCPSSIHSETRFHALVIDLSWFRQRCLYYICPHVSWSSSAAHRKSVAALVAMSGGARHIWQVPETERPRLRDCLAADEFLTSERQFVPTVHGTGKEAFDFRQEEDRVNFSITRNFEMLPLHMVGIREYRHSAQENYGPVAVGIKSFLLPAAKAAPVVLKYSYSAFWGLIQGHCSSDEVGELQELFLLQKILWRVGKMILLHGFHHENMQDENVPSAAGKHAASFAQTLLDAPEPECVSVADCLLELVDNLAPAERSVERAPCRTDLLASWIRDLRDLGYTAPVVEKQSKFVYLIQGANADRKIAGLSQTEETDVLRLTFRTAGRNVNIFYPDSNLNEGRNALLRLALARERGKGYTYFIFMDDDVELVLRDHPDHAWRARMAKDPYRRFEDFLSTFRPALAVNVLSTWSQTLNFPEGGPFNAISVWDPVFVGIHRETVGTLFPQFESSLDASGYAFAGYLQTLLALLLYKSRFLLQCNALETRNTRNHKDDVDDATDYPDRNSPDLLVPFVKRNFRPEFIPHSLGESLGKVLRRKTKLVTRIWRILIEETDFFSLREDLLRRRRCSSAAATVARCPNSYAARDSAFRSMLRPDQEYFQSVSKYRRSPLLWSVLRDRRLLD